MKILVIVLALVATLVACNSDAEREKEVATKPLEGNTAIITREFVSRDMLMTPGRHATLCYFEYNRSWCEGYFIALYSGIENSGSEVCAPRHKKSKKVIFESAWVIVKEFLTRLPDSPKVKFYDSAVLALTEEENCDD
jgi:hypothetical protein|tara:strand:- start:323 stop:736 length:414 start_codon:yes stop_codon:yes gene_type:complete